MRKTMYIAVVLIAMVFSAGSYAEEKQPSKTERIFKRMTIEGTTSLLNNLRLFAQVEPPGVDLTDERVVNYLLAKWFMVALSIWLTIGIMSYIWDNSWVKFQFTFKHNRRDFLFIILIEVVILVTGAFFLLMTLIWTPNWLPSP